MALTTKQIQDLKAGIIAEISVLNMLSQVLDVLTAGSVSVDKEGKVSITLSAQQDIDLKEELQNRNQQLKNIAVLLDQVTS